MAIGASLFDETGNSTSGDAGSRADDVDVAMALIVDTLEAMPVTDAMTRTVRYQNWLAGLEAQLFARNSAAGASDRDNEKLAGEGRKTTKKAAKKRAKRGKAVKENPDLVKDIASGELGPEQTDAIADASAKTDGDAARDDELIDEIKSSAPEDANKIARKWVDEHNDVDEGDSAEARRRRQRTKREVTRFDTEDGLAALLIKGDDESIDEMYAGLKAAAKKLWKQDGGRDVPASKQPRTRRQRMFDAAYASLTRPATRNSTSPGSLPGSGRCKATSTCGSSSTISSLGRTPPNSPMAASSPTPSFLDTPATAPSPQRCSGLMVKSCTKAANTATPPQHKSAASSHATRAASAAAQISPNAKHTTSSRGTLQQKATPTSTTWCLFASTATTSSTTPNKPFSATPKANGNSDRQPPTRSHH